MVARFCLKGGQDWREASVADGVAGGTELVGEGIAGERSAVPAKFVPHDAGGLL